MNQLSRPRVEQIKEITRNIIFALFALLMTSGLDIIIQILSEAELDGIWQLVLTGIVQLLLRGRDKYKYYKAKEEGKSPDSLVMLT